MWLEYIFLLGALFVLLAIAVQDFRSREVFVVYFAGLFIFLCGLQFVRCGFDNIYYLHLFLNISIILIQFLVVYVYLKCIRAIDFFDGVGLGDLLLYACLLPFMSVPVFLFFNVLSLIVVLFVYVAFGKRLKIVSDAIPLAGIQSCFLALSIVVLEGYLHIPFLTTCFDILSLY